MDTRQTFRRIGTSGALAIALVVAASAGQETTDAGRAQSAERKAPVLLFEQQSDVNGDGVMDTVSYFSSHPDGAFDAESIDFGSKGTASLLALRCDYDKDGKEDDWMIVDAPSEEVKAVLLDTNDDGEVDTADLGNGRREPFHGHGPHLPSAATR